MSRLKDFFGRLWASVLRVLDIEDEFPASAHPRKPFSDHLR